ncbi:MULTISPECIES: ZIP family metal transporter [Peribacillus]|uniref:ZIP family metal transporter n=1 Tax=Peribacillus TaxID=2675229 RepID=UPI003017286E|nr:ZIP family metal transporter [Brevibacterium sp. PAMC21349]
MTEGLKVSLFIMMMIFLGTGLGGLATKYVEGVLRRNYRLLHMFCGGLLVGLLGLEIFPETISDYDSLGILAGFSSGIVFMLFMDHILHNMKGVHFEKPQMYIFLFLALFIHSIPTGLALGMSFQDQQLQNSALFSAILIHHFPEGMVMMVSVMVSNANPKVFWVFSFLLSLAVGTTSYLGMTINTGSIKIQTLLLGAALGTLSYVTLYEILWKGASDRFTPLMVGAVLAGFLTFLFLQIAAFSH